MSKYIEALRPKNWIKNLIIFLPFILSLSFDVNVFVKLIIGFLGLCAISSVGYIFNDVVNIKEDRKNPDKRNRVFASGRLAYVHARFINTLLMFLWIGLSFIVPYLFIIGLALLAIDISYTIRLRNIKFLDTISISLKYPIRYLLGGILVGSLFIEWIIPLFFLAIMFATMKRKGELTAFKDKAGDQRVTLRKYTEEGLDSIFNLTLYGLWVSLLFALIRYDLIVPIFASIGTFFYFREFYSKVDYEGSKSLALLKDIKIVIFGGIFAITILLSLYGVIP